MWRFLKKLEIELPYDPAIPLLGVHTKETRSERDMCIPMFIAALLSYGTYTEWEKNSFESVLMRWMKLEPIMQSEVSQKDKDHYNILTHIYGI